MKILNIALAVAIMLVFICLQENSGIPTQELEVMTNEKFEESWKMSYTNRHKRSVKCRFCCGCCKRGVCEVCCRF
ncbi:hepcidin-like isoform X2 [Phyllopteryx taeniolatus]|uniref:hepcidin-like isoform X2 n=1 Tax=Phyllopteryx taeniolatus TaxID=161469 RepID=UPI002AD23341|nr:hepcidin-like isoform X2 [Phyllopteryx taeniolatus]